MAAGDALSVAQDVLTDYALEAIAAGDAMARAYDRLADSWKPVRS